VAKILLADNHAESLLTWSKVLREYGYEVVEASSVAEAQDHLVRGGFDLAVIDLHMERDEDKKDESGLQLASVYRERVPIILYTALDTTELAIKALQRDGRSSPAVAFVRKKEDGVAGLIKAVRQAIVPKVFVSHGHDDNATAAVQKFIDDGGARAIVLREQLTPGQSILAAFEEHANVQFSIILVTPDDEGAKKGEKLRPRARQNVIFELGFFLAKLGRDKVVALYKEEKEPIEWPSNYEGVLYRKMEGDWKIQLAKDLKKAGIALDLLGGGGR
jgi:predicted nucleotide-binding protein